MDTIPSEVLVPHLSQGVPVSGPRARPPGCLAPEEEPFPFAAVPHAWSSASRGLSTSGQGHARAGGW